jgi:Uri superfamily endonuclease
VQWGAMATAGRRHKAYLLHRFMRCYNGRGGGFAQSRATLKGTYLLILHVDADLTDLAIGRLGHAHFAPGYYLYIGSALGPGGIPARLAYHERRVKARPHWHIDYLRAHARLVEAWGVGTLVKVECCWVRALASAPAISIPVPRFGASDNGCPSHLLYAPRRPSLRLLTESLLSCFAEERNQSLTLEIRDYDHE